MTRKEIAGRIQRFKKKGDNFSVKTKSERVMATQEGGALNRFGLIEFKIKTHENADGTFSVMAV